MSVTKYLKHINETNWYKQGGAISMFYVLGAYYGLNESIGYDNDILYQFKEVNCGYFNKDEEKKKLMIALAKQEKDKKFIDVWIKDWEKHVSDNINFLQKSFSKKEMMRWSDQDLVNFLKKQKSLMVKHWAKGVLLEWSDPEGDKILASLLKKFNVSLTAQEISYLIGPEKFTFVQQEYLDRFEIVKKAKNGKNIENLIKKHSQKYHWYQNTWAYVYEYDFNHFSNLVKNDLKNYDKCVKEVNEIKSHLKTVKDARLKIYRQNKFPQGLKNILCMFRQMTDWRDYRKKMGACIPNYYLYQIIKRLSSENNLSEDLVKMITFDDVSGWKISKKVQAELQSRWGGSVYICDKNKKCKWLYGNDAQKVVDILTEKLSSKELRGVIANRGIVRGEVKLVETKEDFLKMKPGNILVAGMTRPEFVPLMKICGGIITDEGGITCHAAVVSRELGKPCLINTQNATTTLKDGDLVELDANNGIVKIINL